MVHRTHGIVMECYIFITDDLLDLEVYIIVRTYWHGVSNYLRYNMSLQSWIYIEALFCGFWTLSPTQPENHKGHELVWVPQYTYQCSRARWHLGSSTKYCTDQYPVRISMVRWCSWSRAREKQPSQEALRTPLKWSKELINEVNETKIQGPLGLSSGICVLSSIEGDLP